jgi:hypothetical protein
MATGLFAGSYVVVITDANGCSITGTGTVSQPAPIVQLIHGKRFSGCVKDKATGEASVAVTGGTARLHLPMEQQCIESASIVRHAPAGTYAVTATDANRLC